MRGSQVKTLGTMLSPVPSPTARASGALSPPPHEPRHRRRDTESRMTAFPPPGSSAPVSPAQAPRTTGQLFTKPLVGKAKEAPRSASMYWMPDHLCKTCYDCGASFTIFRRRHHCRLCGQIFCHACSNQFVDGTMHGFRHQMIRICKFCSRYVTADAEKRQRQLSAASVASRRSSIDDVSIHVQQPAASTPSIVSSIPVDDLTSPFLFSPVNAAAMMPLGEDDPTTHLSDEFVAETQDVPINEVPGYIPDLLSIQSSESVDFSSETAPPQLAPKRSFRRPSMVRRRRSSLDFLQLNDLVGNGNGPSAPPPTAAESASSESIKSPKSVDLSTETPQPKAALMKTSRRPSLMRSRSSFENDQIVIGDDTITPPPPAVEFASSESIKSFKSADLSAETPQPEEALKTLSRRPSLMRSRSSLGDDQKVNGDDAITPLPTAVEFASSESIKSRESVELLPTETPQPTAALEKISRRPSLIRSRSSREFLNENGQNQNGNDPTAAVESTTNDSGTPSESVELSTQTPQPKVAQKKITRLPSLMDDQSESENDASAPRRTATKSASIVSIKSSESVDLSVETPQPETAPPKTLRRPSLMRQHSTIGDDQTVHGNDVIASLPSDIEPASINSETPLEISVPVPLERQDGESFRVKTDLHTQREIVLDKYMTAAHDRIREGIQRSVDRSMKHFVGDGIEVKRLVSSLEDMAFIVTGHLLFSMNFRTPNGFNFSGLVKVKSIATPTQRSPTNSSAYDPYSFKWLAGCVCRKQLSHKQMARKIDNPRILLLACAISYDRTVGTNKLSSLDALIESEKSYMGILVDKISKLEPDIVFVERTVSRHAQELLRERGIAIVLNVKNETLERIARYTGAKVLSSVDHVDQADPEEVIGRCRTFYAQSTPVVADDAEAQANGDATSNGNGVQRAPSMRPKTDTYLYLDGCDPLNGCTVLITGPSKKKLRIMKTLMRTVLLMTYRTLLEAHMLSGLGLGFSDWYRRSLADHQDRAAWCTTCTLRQSETIEGQLRYYQCSGSKQIGIAPYSKDDISLGNFLLKEMQALSYRCHNPKCDYTMVDHVQTFSCTMGTVTVSYEELPEPSGDSLVGEGPDGSYINVLTLLGNNESSSSPMQTIEEGDEADCPTIVYGKWCSECSCMICPFTPLKKYVYKFSLARLLEILLSDCYPQPPALEDVDTNPVTATGCPHDFMKSHVLFFNVGRIVARMDFTARKPLRLFNTPTFVVVNGTRRRRSTTLGVRSCPPNEKKANLIGLAASRGITMLRTLLEKLFELFMGKIMGIEEAVLACEDEDGVATEVLIEVALAKKLVNTEHVAFAQRLAAIEEDEEPEKRLAETDRAKRALYYVVCSWIEEIQKLRKTLRSTLAIESEPVASASAFSLTNFSFSTPTTQSPVMSPGSARQSSPRRSRPASKNATSFSVDERSRASSAAMSVNTVADVNELFDTPSPKVVKSMSTPVQSSQMSTASTKSETKDSGWKSMLWDIYKAVGRSTPGDDLELPLPPELLEGHPSLSSRSNDCVFLVSETEPITYVAYALASQSYEDQIAAWKATVCPAEPANDTSSETESGIELSNSASALEWTRTALSTTAQVHFKHSVVDNPRHLALLYPSGSNTSGCWEFSTIAFFPLQFEALRELFYGRRPDFLFSISHVNNWAALGGKSGASFYRTLDNRFVVKHVSSTEQQSFLDVLPTYFEYMSNVFHEETPSVISKIVGMYQTTITKKDTGARTIHHIVVMENAFYGHEISKTYDLKGSSRNRYVKPDADGKPRAVELDGNFVEMTEGHPMGVIAEDHELLLSAIKNDAAFLTAINIVDFSLVLGLGGETPDLPNAYTHMTVGIIDYMRQFDLMKRVESVSKSVAMIAGQSSPTIIEPALYAKRFSDAIKRYFMPVTPIDSNRNDPYIPPSQ